MRSLPRRSGSASASPRSRGSAAKRAAKRAAERPAKRPSKRPAERSAERSAERPAERPAKRGAVALVRVGALPERSRSDAEQRLAALVARLSGLDAEHRSLSDALSDFSEQSEERLGAAMDEVFRAERVARRLAQLEAELAAAIEHAEQRGEARGARVRRAARRHLPGEAGATPFAARDASVAPEPEPALDLKELYRRLARRAHPDLARGKEERAWRSQFMSQLNAAYADEDRVRLELLASEIEGGAESTEASAETRDAHAQRRLAALAPAIERLERDLRRLRTSGSFRRFERYRECEARGGEYFAEERRVLEERARALRASQAERAARVEQAVSSLNAALGASTRAVGRRVAFRAAVVSPGRLSADGARFRDALGKLAREAPWKAAWVIAAFFAEVAERPPEGLCSFEAWAERHERLRPLLRGAPSFDEALADLPPSLELGCRVYPRGVRFGVQLRDPLHLAGVAAALTSAPCQAIAADVLRALGRQRTCARCRRPVEPVHLHRVRDLDPLHALVCGRCGAVLESYRTCGRPEGLEALAPYAVAAGVVAEQGVSFGGVTIRLGMLPEERRHLTAGALARRVAEVVLEGLPADVAARKLRVQSGRVVLAESARVPLRARVTVSFADRKAPGPARVVALLRARQRTRFRRS